MEQTEGKTCREIQEIDLIVRRLRNCLCQYHYCTAISASCRCDYLTLCPDDMTDRPKEKRGCGLLLLVMNHDLVSFVASKLA